MQHPSNITVLSAFGDNYIYVTEYAAGKYFVVDPGDPWPVLEMLKGRKKAAELTHILATHHHTDHIGGIGQLKKHTRCKVIGPDAERIGGLDTVMREGQTIQLDEVTIRCVATPGHTATSVCYFVSGGPLPQPVLFTGDTLFVCGCGRMFECGGQTMFNSLERLGALPDETLVYPGHDYTEENIEFALIYDPDNERLEEKLMQVQQQNNRGKPTVPSTLGEEKQLNPFLKAADWQTFATLRQKKDAF